MIQNSSTIKEIDSALTANWTALFDAFLDLLAALILLVTTLFSFLHAILRIAFAALGLMLWSLALLIIGLYWLRSWAVSHSSSSLHTRGE